MRRGPSALVVAAALHGALLAAIAVAPRSHPRPHRDLDPKSLEIELDLRSETEAPPPSPLPVDAEERDPNEAFRRPVAALSPKTAPRGRDSDTDPAEALRAPELPPLLEDRRDEAPPGYRAQPPDLFGGRGQGTLGLAALSSLEASDTKEKGAEHAVRRSLQEHDFKLGLGVSGPVVAAAEDVARRSVASVESHAVLSVVADGEGKIVQVGVSEVSEDRAGWETVARGLLEALRATRVRVAKGSRGVVMTIAIDSREALPSGTSPGVNVTLFNQKVHSGKNDRSAAISVLPLARIPILVPARGRPGGVEEKMIVLPVPLPSVSGVFDPVDFGAKANRVVHAHATSEEEL
jgi:hypothetical protein